MIADLSQKSVSAGSLSPELFLPDAARLAILDFVAGELPRWRDNPRRLREMSEPRLTEQLRSHLNVAARTTAGMDFLQFSTENTDEMDRTRKIDLAPQPCGPVVWIQGRRHTEFDMLLPIECKRLPTPKRSDRDEREYVFSSFGTVGGIQRFKLAMHGGAHSLAAMVAYVQDGAPAAWCARIIDWIVGLAKVDNDWSPDDRPEVKSFEPVQRVTRLRSRHRRPRGLPDIELEHLWVEMG